MTTIVKPLGFETTGLPGIESARIEPSDKFGVHVVIKLHGVDKPISFGAEEFGTLVDGLGGLLPYVRSMAQAYAAEDESPGDVL